MRKDLKKQLDISQQTTDSWSDVKRSAAGIGHIPRVNKRLKDIFAEIGHPIPEGCKLIYSPSIGFQLYNQNREHSCWCDYGADGHHWTNFHQPNEYNQSQFDIAPEMCNYPANDCAAALVYWHVLELQHG